MKIIFLHIPKTAGQSVHKALVDTFGRDAVCPARVNDQLRKMSISDINRYRVFSGHLDWSLLDCVKGPKYVFTVLREPMDRILSFYFYLREEAEKLTAEQRNQPQCQGMKAVHELGPRDYFLGGAPHIRRFIDDHYDNFYSYYFASRYYESRSKLVPMIGRGELSHHDVLRMAKENLSALDKVFTVDNMADVFATIREMSGKNQTSNEEYRVNVNTKLAAEERRARIQALGADAATMARLQEYCLFDNELWKIYSANAHSVKPGAGARLRNT